MCDLPQTLLEPILLEAAAARGTEVRFNTEYLSLEQDADAVTATVRHRPSGALSHIRAKYLLGADGSRSKVADDVGLPLAGQMGIAGSMNILIRADLAHLVEHRPSVLYWILQPGSTIGGVGMGVVRMVRPWNEWLLIWGYDIDEPPPQVDEAEARRIAHRLIGDDSIDVEVEDIALWTNNGAYMTRYSSGRVFCMGDACHRHPPNNGLGANTSIQDSYNLAWKLAHVLRGEAGTSLLDTYDDERAPVGRQIVERANKSIAEFGAIFEAFGLTDATDAEQMRANMAARKDDTPQGAAQREQLRRAMALKNYEFNAHGVELNQRYKSAAVVVDGTEEPAYERDPELYYQPTTWPGARLPHCWVEYRGRKVSTLDLAGKGRFTLFTGIGGESWAQAAATVSACTSMSVTAFVIGPGRDVLDLYDEWYALSEVSEHGCVLVRPDLHVAWRSRDLVADPTATLGRVLAAILGGRSVEDAGIALVGSVASA
jgi:2,4-dichlorophenol 6-monooxygenase